MFWTLAVSLVLAGVLETHANVEIKSLHMTTYIFHRYASTLVSSRMVNPANQTAEASFVLTYPDSAFITKFVIEANGKEYKAKMKSKDDVKELEKENRNDDFSIFVRDSHRITVSTKVEAHGEVNFVMDYEELLPRNLGVYSNVITVNPGQIVDDLKLTVHIEEPTAIINLRVPEFQDFIETASEDHVNQNRLAKIEEKSPENKTVVWAPTPEQQRAINAEGVRGQFIVKYSLDHQRETVQSYVMDDLNYVANFLALDDLPRLKKHMIFVLDYSYSMEGQKLDELRQAMDNILIDLDPKDYFSVVFIQSYAEVWSPKNLYRTGPDTMQDYDREHMMKSDYNLSQSLTPEFLVEASPANVEQARKYLWEAELGATYLMGGWKEALDLVNIGFEHWKNVSDPPHSIIVFLSDGEPNMGEHDKDAIVDRVKALNVKQCAIYSLAFGYYADYDFLRSLSLTNYGSTHVIYQAADTSVQLMKFFESIASPLLTDITVTYMSEKIKNITRSKFPLYFKGSELVVAGKVKREAIEDLHSIGEMSALSTSAVGVQHYIISEKKKVEGNSVTKLFEYLWITQMLDKLESQLEANERKRIEEALLDITIQCTFFTTYTPLVVEKPDGSKTVVEITPVKQAPPLEKVDLKSIKWLQEYLKKDTSATEVTVAVKDKKYNLALKPANKAYGPCKANHMLGECRHFQKCALEIFEDDISDFLPYKCDLPGNFLGVCCPLHVS